MGLVSGLVGNGADSSTVFIEESKIVGFSGQFLRLNVVQRASQ
jgi:hypothetical protein